MKLIGEIWQRATGVQPVPDPELITLAALLAAALVLVPATWPMVRMIITITHEGGHAFAALITGRRLRGIRLHTDTSGLTISSGPPRGPGMIITLLAGYLSPAAMGLIAALLFIRGHSLGLLWLLVVLLIAMVVQIRNFAGFGVLIAALAAMIAISWYLPAERQSLIACLITWILLVAAPKPVVELARQRRGSSDADQLARLTRIPRALWIAVFLLANLCGLGVGIVWLLPGLVASITSRWG